MKNKTETAVGVHINLPAKGVHHSFSVTESFPIVIETYREVKPSVTHNVVKFVFFRNIKLWLKGIPSFFFQKHLETIIPHENLVVRKFALDISGKTPKWIEKK